MAINDTVLLRPSDARCDAIVNLKSWRGLKTPTKLLHPSYQKLNWAAEKLDVLVPNFGEEA